jgi:hypothetical protein
MNDRIDDFISGLQERIFEETRAVCGSLAAELSLGRTPDELMDFSGEKILEVLGAFPEEDRHCAFLAAETVQAAVGDYMKKLVKPNIGNSEHLERSTQAGS